MQKELLKIENIKKSFIIKSKLYEKKQELLAVNDVSFSLFEGEIFGLVGESGCGKSTLAKLILRLIEPTAGRIIYNGRDIFDLKKSAMKSVRKDIQIIFQDPLASLNPRMTVGQTVSEGLAIHNQNSKRERRPRTEKLLELVGIHKESINMYPHEFSGGQRQRIGVARALSVNPKIIIADEPVSALDVSIQAQILNLLKDLQERLNLTYVFISHDLRVVEYLSDRVGVMYLGKMMELASSRDLYRQPLHPYTSALLSAVPSVEPKKRVKKVILKGDVPNPINPPSGCIFHTRCFYAKDECKEDVPELREVKNGHFSACLFAEDIFL
jgi:oligopeptide/dipeptide ABC transporter ATP-binding protein